jgi:hypothetical protein
MFNYAEIGGSPEEIHQNILQIPMMEKFEEQMFTLQRLEASLRISCSLVYRWRCVKNKFLFM